jgi:hypothetical protein
MGRDESKMAGKPFLNKAKTGRQVNFSVTNNFLQYF